MENNVKVLKLNTGEEILAKVEQKNTMLVLEKPMVLHVGPGPRPGQLTHTLFPFLYSGKAAKISISVDHVIAQDDPKDQIEREYLSIITGLTL